MLCMSAVTQWFLCWCTPLRSWCPWGRPCWSCSSSSVPRLWRPSEEQHSSSVQAATPAPSPQWTPNSSPNAATSHPGCSSVLSPPMQSQQIHRAPAEAGTGELGSLSTVEFTQCVRASASGWATRPQPQTSQATRWRCCRTWTSTMSTRSSTSLRRRATAPDQAALAVWESMRDTGTRTAPTHTLLYGRWLPLRTWWRGGSYASTWPACVCWVASRGGNEDFACSSHTHGIAHSVKYSTNTDIFITKDSTPPAQSKLLVSGLHVYTPGLGQRGSDVCSCCFYLFLGGTKNERVVAVSLVIWKSRLKFITGSACKGLKPVGLSGTWLGVIPLILKVEVSKQVCEDKLYKPYFGSRESCVKYKKLPPQLISLESTLDKAEDYNLKKKKTEKKVWR